MPTCRSTDCDETTMTGTTRIPPAEITGLFGMLAKRMSKKMLGEVAEPLGPRSTAVAGVRQVHFAGAGRHGVRRGYDPHAADRDR
jgi:hypothetical protein